MSSRALQRPPPSSNASQPKKRKHSDSPPIIFPSSSIAHAQPNGNPDAPQQFPTGRLYINSRLPKPYSQERIDRVPRDKNSRSILTDGDDYSLTAWALDTIANKTTPTLIGLKMVRKRWNLALRPERWVGVVYGEGYSGIRSPNDGPLKFNDDYQVEAIYGALVGVLLQGRNRCSNCSKGNGPFPHCIIVPSHLQNKCVNCHYTKPFEKCSCELRASTMRVDFIVSLLPPPRPDNDRPDRSAGFPPAPTPSFTPQLPVCAYKNEQPGAVQLLEHATLQRILFEQENSVLMDILSFLGPNELQYILCIKGPGKLLDLLLARGPGVLLDILTARGPSHLLGVILGGERGQLHQILSAHGWETFLDVLLAQGPTKLLGLLKAQGPEVLLDILLSQGTCDFLEVLLARGVGPLQQICKELSPAMRAEIFDGVQPPDINHEDYGQEDEPSSDEAEESDYDSEVEDAAENLLQKVDLLKQSYEAQMQKLAQQLAEIGQLAKQVAKQGQLSGIIALAELTSQEYEESIRLRRAQEHGGMTLLRTQFEQTWRRQLMRKATRETYESD